MADFIDSEASEEEEEEELTEKERKRLKKLKATAIDSSEEEDEEEDEDKLREELGDLIDDNPIEEDSSSSESSDDEKGGTKRKRDDDDELDDRLSEEDFELLEENLGIKVKRKKTFVRVKRIEDDESDDEGPNKGDDRDAIANELFEGSDGEDDRRKQRDRVRGRADSDKEMDEDKYSEEEDEDEEDIGDFIVDAEGQPIHGKKKKRKAIYTDAALQEAQDIFGVDFDYDDIQEGDEYDEEEEEGEEYEDEEGVRRTRKKVDKVAKKKSQRKTIYEVYEPSELERGHFTDLDEQIRKTDIPERMQLRQVPVSTVEEGSVELEMEAEWIYKYAFSKPSISNQERTVGGGRDSAPKGPGTVEKIRKALEFMRCQHLEVPFIAFYRKEYVQPDLNINDLWRVYKYDEKWTQLQTRKKNMMRLFDKMLKFQSEKLTSSASESSIPDGVRILRGEDTDRLRSVQSLEELKDVYNHFILYYGADVPAMQEADRRKRREEARERKANARKRMDEDGEPMDVDELAEGLEEDLDLEDESTTVKQATRSDLYSLCVKAGLDGMLRKYGLTSEQFAENMRDNYQRHEVEQYPTEPLDAALEYVTPKFATPGEVLKAANYMLAVQIAREPLVRQCVRETFYERARIDVKPTKQGIKEIDENHALYAVKFLKDKFVRDLSGDQFLRLVVGEQDKLVTITFQTNVEGATSSSYVDEVKQLFQRDEFSKLVQDWNDQRNQVVDIALNKFVFPALVKELKAKLMVEARESILRACCQQLYDWLKVAPYKVDFPDEEDEWDTKNGIRVMALSYVADLDQAAFGCLVNPDGECTDHIRLEHILKRKNAWREMDRVGKEKDLTLLRNFILNKKPHVIAVSGESREANMLMEDLRAVTQNLVEDEQWPLIHVELVDNSLAKVFANSTRGETEFREYPHLLREAISIARLLQDPLVEHAQLCNSDEEILCLKFHPMQDQLSKDELLESLYVEFVNRTNEVGVDINRAINYPHTANLVQFVCGLGPRKGQALIKILKQNNQRLENRTQLVTACHMGPKVFINCAGFIKIDTNSLGDSTESYVEVLDGSRVHPETYEWARKMAVDALEYDDEDANPAGAVEEILEAPERLKDLDLDAFADELERQGFGNKRITLYDIRSELNHRYKDGRVSYQAPSPEEVFNMLTKENPQTFYIGKLVMATVTGFQHRKPKPEDLDRANPSRDDQTGLWMCPFCRQNDFPDMSDVWNHFDAGSCAGQAIGVRIRLDNSLSGFIPLKCLSDSEVTNPEERVRPNQTIFCRITKIDVERFSVMATSKSSDLMDRNAEWKPPKDPYYDTAAEEAIQRAEEEAKKLKNRQSYTKRVIVHPSFKNIGFKDAEKLMAGMDQGEVIVRPSSKGTNHLTVMWKVGEGIYQNVDVREEGKENAFSLGQSLWIGDEEFEDLDEIVARYINPMAGHARDIYAFRYFRDLGLAPDAWAPGKEREKADELIKDDKRRNPAKIHYFVSASKEFPGKFMLTYLPRAHAKHEFITVTPEGFRFRGQVHDSLASLFRWFKEHFRDPIPGTPRSGHHPSSSSSTSSRTPGGGFGTTPNVNPETLQRVAQSIPSHMLQSLSQAAHFGTPTGFAYPANTPYTPSGTTPFMTPFAATPHQPQTPRVSGTPAPSATPSQPGVFRTPAAPAAAAPKGYGAQSYSNSSPFNRNPGANRSNPSGAAPSGRSGSAASSSSSSADWGLPPEESSWGASASNGSKSRSAGGPEPDDWRAAADAWASSASSRSKNSSSANPAAARSDGWGTPNSSSGGRGKTTPAASSSSGGGAADDWGIPASDLATTGVGAGSSSGDPWASSGADSSDPWAPSPSSAPKRTAQPTASSSSSAMDDWGSSSSSSRPSSGGGRGGGRGGRGGGAGGGNSRACYKCNKEGHFSRDCPNPPSSSSSSGSSRGGRGGGGGGGGGRACFKCNQEGHFSRECPNTSGGGGDRNWNSSSSSSSRPNSRSTGPPPASSAADDDWGIPAEPAVSGGSSSAADPWGTGGSSSNKTAAAPSNEWDIPATTGSKSSSAAPPANDWDADGWGSSGTKTTSTPSTPKTTGGGSSASKTTSDNWDDGGWGASASSTSNKNVDDDPWAPTAPSAPRSRTTSGANKSNDDWGTSGGSSGNSSWSGGGGSGSRGGSGGGGGSRACYKCNQEGHMARDCPNADSRGGGGGGGGRRGGSGWTPGTGANAAPLNPRSGRTTPAAGSSSGGGTANKSVDDDWGLPASELASGSSGRSSSAAAAADPWGTDKSTDDWGSSRNDPWGSSSSKSSNQRSGRPSAAAAAEESWDTEPAVKAPAVSSAADDPWGAPPPGTNAKSSSGRSGNRSPKANEWGDATPLYDE